MTVHGILLVVRSISVKKILITALVLFLLLGIALFDRWYRNRTKQPDTDVMIPLTKIPSPGIEPLPTYPNFFVVTDTNLPAAPTDWNRGDNPTYSLTFPNDWVPITDAVSGGGIHVFLHPRTSDNKYFPRIDIENMPGDTTASIGNKMKQLEDFTKNVSQKWTTFRGLPTMQMSEVLPISDTKGHQLHKTYLFFSNKTNSYTITYAYFDDEKAESNQYIILQILNTLILK